MCCNELGTVLSSCSLTKAFLFVPFPPIAGNLFVVTLLEAEEDSESCLLSTVTYPPYDSVSIHIISSLSHVSACTIMSKWKAGIVRSSIIRALRHSFSLLKKKQHLEQYFSGDVEGFLEDCADKAFLVATGSSRTESTAQVDRCDYDVRQWCKR